MSQANRKLVKRSYKLGGMKNEDSQQEVGWVMAQIDGVEEARVDSGNILNLTYDEKTVLEDHLKSTLNSLGHSILND